MKLKEVCNLHAEAYSGAEFQHGPIALVSRDYPILIFSPADKSAELFDSTYNGTLPKGSSCLHNRSMNDVLGPSDYQCLSVTIRKLTPFA